MLSKRLDSEICKEWIETEFKPPTHEKANLVYVGQQCLVKMKQVVHTKEEEKASKGSSEFVLPNPGHGYIWTTDAVLETLTTHQEQKEREVTVQAEKAKRREEIAQKRAALEVEWKALRESHA